MAIHFLYYFYCKNCSLRIVLPHSIHESISTFQTDPSKGLPSLVLVCHVCGHGYDYTQRDIRLESSDTPDPHSIPCRDRPIALSMQIECAEQSCKFPITVHMPEDYDRQPAEVSISAWKLHDVKCPQGHPFRIPLKLASKKGTHQI